MLSSVIAAEIGLICVLGVLLAKNVLARVAAHPQQPVPPLVQVLRNEGFLEPGQTLMPLRELAALASGDAALCNWLVHSVKDNAREVRLRREAFYVLRDLQPQGARLRIIDDLLDWRDSLGKPSPQDLEVHQAMARWLPHVLLDMDLPPDQILPLLKRADPGGWRNAAAQHGTTDSVSRRDMSPEELARWDLARARALDTLGLAARQEQVHDAGQPGDSR
jgi:hypothetical protein